MSNKLVYGATQIEIDVAGYTVEQIEAANADQLNLYPQLVAYVAGVKAESNFVVQAGQLVEWIRER